MLGQLVLLLEVMQEDYIRTARSKGLKQKMVIIKHGLKNALIPVITICLFAVVLFGTKTATAGTAQANYEAELNTLMLSLLPGSTSFAEEAYEGEDANIKAVYRADNGCVIMTVMW